MQKIAKLSEKKALGGIDTNTITFTPPIQFTRFGPACVTFQVNCKSLLIACDPMPTMPSGCGSCPTTDTNPTTFPTLVAC